MIWDELEKICGGKMSENAQNPEFLGKNPWAVPVPKEWYRYRDAVGNWYLYRSNRYRYRLAVDDQYRYRSKGYRYHYFQQPRFCLLCIVSPVFIHLLFRDPKKRLMGVQIRMRLSKKRIVPRHSPRRYSFSMIICLTTKSEEFAFDKVRVKTIT